MSCEGGRVGVVTKLSGSNRSPWNFPPRPHVGRQSLSLILLVVVCACVCVRMCCQTVIVPLNQQSPTWTGAVSCARQYETDNLVMCH